MGACAICKRKCDYIPPEVLCHLCQESRMHGTTTEEEPDFDLKDALKTAFFGEAWQLGWGVVVGIGFICIVIVSCEPEGSNKYKTSFEECYSERTKGYFAMSEIDAGVHCTRVTR